MNTLGTAVKAINPFSLSGRNKAQGQFKTGMNANQIYAQYYKWLGQTGSPADTDTVLAFLQQNGYGEQAVKAAQSKFPAAPQQTTPANTSTTATPTATPPANQKLTPQQQTALKAKMQGQRQGGANMSAKTGTGFKDYVDGSPKTKGFTAGPGGAPVPTPNKIMREGVELNKQQLSDIFTAVAQTGATPQQSADNSGNAVGNNTVGQDGDSSSSGTPADAAPTGSTATGKSSQMPNRLTPDDILRYYAKLDKPDERLKVKNGIPEVDKQLDKTSQQID